jgi:cleavage and polyadenylation specificity factor subunit 1
MSRDDATSTVTAIGNSKSRLLTVLDKKSKLTFLIDTGAAVSVLPPLPADLKNEESSNLRAANGSHIPIYGERYLTLNIGLRKDISWPFVIAKVDRPIIGADLLTHYKLVVDLHNRRLMDTSTSLSTFAGLESASDTLNTVGDDPDCYKELLTKYKPITTPNTATTVPKHAVRHTIETSGRPVFVRPRRLHPKVAESAKEAVKGMLQDGVIRPSKSPWASPLHVVPKKVGWRLVGDYRMLNAQTKRDSYPLPHLQDFSAQLSGKTIFSKVDLASAYFQIPMDEDSIAKTAITTPFGSYEFTRMPYGLSGAAQTFQRFLDTALRDMSVAGRAVVCFNYVDDILIASSSETEHLLDLEELFTRLSAHGLVISPLKCEFGRPEIDFLGHRITSQGILPLPEKVKAVNDFDKPVTIRNLRTYLGMINFYHRFLPNIALTMAPLNQLLMGKPKKHDKIVWDPGATQAFEDAKSALAAATMLQHPAPDAPISIAVDASNTTVGGVLQQLHNDDWRPLAFFSKKLQPRERKYSTFGRELLAAFLSVKHFRYYITGLDFTIFTDHKPLVGAIHKRQERDIPRESRQLSFISQFTTDLRHVAGESNQVADALSRCHEQEDSVTTLPPDQYDEDSDFLLSAVFQDADEERLRTEQSKDQELEALLEDEDSSLRLSLVDGIHMHIHDNVCRPYIPQPMRKDFFKRVHDTTHPGKRATLRQLTARYVWPAMKKDIKLWCEECNSCQKGKITRHNFVQSQTIPPEGGKFAQVHLDLVGPLPPNEGYVYLLTMIDRHTRWPEICPIKDARAETVSKAFLSTWVSRYGCPISITTDRGPQFESALWTSLMETLGSVRIRTTAYHPRANGLIERLHRTVKGALKTQADPHYWLEKLPLILLSMRSAVKEDLNYSTAELMFGVNLRLPCDLLVKNHNPALTDITEYNQRLRTFMNDVGPAQSRPTHSSAGYLDSKLKTATHVFVRVDRVRRPLEAPYEGPFEVVLRSANYFTIRRRGKTDNVHVSRLKAAHGIDDIFPARHSTVTLQLGVVPPPAPSPVIQQQSTTPMVPQTQPPSQVSQPTTTADDVAIAAKRARRVTINPKPQVRLVPRQTRYGREVRAPDRLDV